MSRVASLGSGIIQYFKGSYRELRAVTWPTRQEIIRYTIVVLITIVISVLVISGFDYIFRLLTDKYLIR